MAGTPCKDHLGNKFESKLQMCKFWGVTKSTFNYRIQNGFTLEQALTFDRDIKRKPKAIKDHLGNEFESIQQMCKHYDITYSIFKSMTKKGYTLEYILTYKTKIEDHLGNKFKSYQQLCQYHNISYVAFLSRKSQNLSIKQCIEQCLALHQVNDHLGNIFPSIDDMLDYYKISKPNYYSRKNRGYTLEECLCGKTIQDHIGNKFRTRIDMCKYWSIKPCTYDDKIKRGIPMNEALTSLCNLQQISEKLTVIRLLESHFYEVKFNDETDIWSHDEIMEHYRSTHNIPKPINAA